MQSGPINGPFGSEVKCHPPHRFSRCRPRRRYRNLIKMPVVPGLTRGPIATGRRCARASGCGGAHHNSLWLWVRLRGDDRRVRGDDERGSLPSLWNPYISGRRTISFSNGVLTTFDLRHFVKPHDR
jgi:hypothetical protein